MLRFALIGCGRVVERGHMSGIQPLLGKELEAIAVADPYEPRRELMGDTLGVPPERRFADYRDILARDDVDLVDLALPHHAHEEVLIAAARAGKNIISEKPLTTDMASARRIAAAVRESGVRFFIMHNDRFNPRYAGAREAVASGRIGRPFLFRGERVGFGFYEGRGEDPAWRVKREVAGGGCVLDSSYHTIYTAEALMGSPIVSVSAALGTYTQDWDVEDTAVMTLTHASEGVSLLLLSHGIRGQGAAVEELHGTEGSIRLGGSPSMEIFEHAAGEWKALPSAEGPPGFAGAFLAAIEVMNGAALPWFSLETAMHNLAVVEAVYTAAQDRRVVSVEEIEQDTD